MKIIKFLTVGFTLVILGCSRSPQPIIYGQDGCVNCLMIITDPRYGAELITGKGKVYKFDSIECLADYSKKIDGKNISSMWVTDFTDRENFVSVQKAFFIKSNELRSPMGLNLTAFSNEKDLMKSIKKYSGRSLTWEQLTNYVRVSWGE